jgi:hypothetical protein
MTTHDLHVLRRVLRHVATSDPALQAEVLRLDGILAALIRSRQTTGTPAS